MFIMQKVINHIKNGNNKKKALKIKLIIFTMILLILKVLNQIC